MQIETYAPRLARLCLFFPFDLADFLLFRYVLLFHVGKVAGSDGSFFFVSERRRISTEFLFLFLFSLFSFGATYYCYFLSVIIIIAIV
jgi:hypothetical protein